MQATLRLFVSRAFERTVTVSLVPVKQVSLSRDIPSLSATLTILPLRQKFDRTSAGAGIRHVSIRLSLPVSNWKLMGSKIQTTVNVNTDTTIKDVVHDVVDL